jgi:hypothetical protein
MKKEKQTALAVAITIIVAAAIVAYAVISAKPINRSIGTLQIDARLSNTGTQDTTEFVMNTTWRIEWIINKQNDNLFFLAALIKNGTGYSPVADTSETDTNTTRGILPVPYTGTFIIRVIASSDTEWTLYIEEIKPA